MATFFIGLGLAVCNILVLWLIDTELMPKDMEHAEKNFYDVDGRIVLVFIIRTLNALFGVFMTLREVTSLSFVKRFRLEDWTVRGVAYIYVGLLTAQRCSGVDVPMRSAQDTGFWLSNYIEPMVSRPATVHFIFSLTRASQNAASVNVLLPLCSSHGSAQLQYSVG